MMIFIIVCQLYNPSLSLGILLPDNDTEIRFTYFYHIELENSFIKGPIVPGIFADFFMLLIAQAYHWPLGQAVVDCN
jgi:hypothetical protein